MKIYRVWTDSNNKITYTLGYCRDKENAEKFLKLLGDRTAASPDCGVEEIELLDIGTCKTCRFSRPGSFRLLCDKLITGITEDFYCAKYKTKEVER